MQRVEGIWVKI